MAISNRAAMPFRDVFPEGLWLRSEVKPVADFDAPVRGDGSRPQEVDKASGLPMWAADFMDGDMSVGKKDAVITVKFAARVQPVPPAKPSPELKMTAVELVGLEITPYVEYGSGKNSEGKDRARVAWSYRATDMVEPGTAKRAAVVASSGKEAA